MNKRLLLLQLPQPLRMLTQVFVYVDVIEVGFRRLTKRQIAVRFQIAAEFRVGRQNRCREDLGCCQVKVVSDGH